MLNCQCALSVAEWRNWQTHQTQNLAFFTERVGSTPTSATIDHPQGRLYGNDKLVWMIVIVNNLDMRTKVRTNGAKVGEFWVSVPLGFVSKKPENVHSVTIMTPRSQQ